MSKKALLEILDAWRERLHLDRWEIEVEFDHPEYAPADVYATIKPHDAYDSAKLKIAPGWEKWDRPHANRVVVHELCHLLLRDVDEVALRALADENDFQRETYLNAQESTVERICQRFISLVGEA